MDGDIGLGITVDWQEIGMEFRRHGWSVTKVARAINLPRDTVRAWFERGGQPRYVSGLCLLRLRSHVIEKRKVDIRFAVRV